MSGLILSDIDDAAYECLSALACVETYDTNLRDHKDAWSAIEAFAAKVASAEVAKERERCKEIASKYSMRSGIGDDGVAAAEAIEQEIASEPSAQK
jgi:tRNA G10  N-methylase Trm11